MGPCKHFTVPLLPFGSATPVLRPESKMYVRKELLHLLLMYNTRECLWHVCAVWCFQEPEKTFLSLEFPAQVCEQLQRAKLFGFALMVENAVALSVG